MSNYPSPDANTVLAAVRQALKVMDDQELQIKSITTSMTPSRFDQITQAVSQPLRLNPAELAAAASGEKILTMLTKTVAAVARTDQARYAALFSEYEHLKLTATRLVEMQALMDGISTSQQDGRLALSASLRSVTASLSSLAASVWQEFAAEPTTLQTLPKWLLKAPIVQAHEASRNVVQIVATEAETEVEIDAPPATNRDEFSTLIERLAAIGQEFANTFLGAKEALSAKRHDYVRHVCVSLRELLLQLIDKLAPIEVVRDWPEGAALLRKDQTRKARLKYLYREVRSDSYAAFADRDVDSILQTFYALNDGVHILKSPLIDEIMNVLMARVEGQLLLLLTVAKR